MTAMLLTVGMLTSLMPQNFVFAAENASETDATEQTVPEEKSGEVTATFDQAYDGVDTEGLDFSSCELLIATEDAGIFTEDTEVVSGYDGVYLTRYPNAETAKNAYTYYYDKADFVDVNSVIKASENGDDNKTEDEENSSDDEDVPQQKESDKTEPSEEVANDGHGEADMSNLNKGDDAIANLNDVDFEETTDEKENPYKGFIALIDTGAEKKGIVKEAVSLIGDETEDDNGHGTDMVKAITDANKDAKVISVKALNKDGKGNVSDVYAAIKYAIELKVSVINLSMSSVKSAESQILEDVINEATDNGIIVVASAGNNGKDAKYYTPANVEKAYTIGACDEEGKLLKTSNSGKVVDYYVVADSTSEAAAKFSAYAAKDFKNIKNNENIFVKPTKEDDKENEDNKEEKETENTNEKDSDSEKITDDSEDIEVKVNSWSDSDATLKPWTYIGEHDGYTVYKSGNMGHASTTEGNRTWWYLCWYDSSGYLKWSAKAYCLDHDRAAPINQSLDDTAFSYRTDPAMVKSFFWSKADLAQYYVDGNTIYEYGDPKMEGTYAFYNMNYGPMGNDATSDLLRYAVGKPRTADAGKADYDRVVGYSFPSDTAKYVKWSEMCQAKDSQHIDTNYDWYSEANFTDIFVVKASNSKLSTGTFSTLSPSDWEWRQTQQDFHTKNYIKFSGGEDGLAMFIGTVPANSTYVVHCSDGTTTKTFNTGSKFVLYSGDSLEIMTSKTNGTMTLTEDIRENHAYGFYVSIAEWDSNHQRMGYLNGVQGTAAQLTYNLPSTSYLGFRKQIITPSGTTTYDTADDIWFEVYDGDGANANFLGYMITGDDSSNKGVAWYVKDGNKTKINGDGAVGVPVGSTVYLYELGKWNSTYNAYEAPKDSTDAEVKLVNTTTQLRSRKGYYKKFTMTTVSETTWKAMTAANIPKVPNTTTPTTVTLTKTSSAPAYSGNNPNYSLKNTEFTVYKTKTGDTLSNEVGKITVNENGTASTLQLDKSMDRVNGQMVETTFYIKETKAGKGYKLNTDIITQRVSPQTAKSFSVTNTPLTDPIEITMEKVPDSGSTDTNPNGTLEGAEFTVKFYAQDTTQAFNPSAAANKTWVFKSIKDPLTNKITIVFDTAHRVSGTDYFENNKLTLPYGYMTIKETKAPKGYKLSKDLSFKSNTGSEIKAGNDGTLILKIDQNGESGIGTASAVYEVIPPQQMGNIVEDELRADIIIKKVDHNGDPMGGVKFEIEENTTKEKVIVVTDDDGIFCSATTYVPHSTNTNAGVAKCGTWFGNINRVKDSVGALYYGTYTIRELRCEANKDEQLEKAITIPVNEQTADTIIPVYDANASDSQEFIWNMPKPEIHTDAKVVETDSKILGQPGAECPDDDTIQDTHTYPANFDYTDQTITDDMFYSRLRADSKYKAVAELMVIDLETGAVTPYMEDDGTGNMVPYVRITPFTTDADYEHSIYEKEDHVPVTLDHIDPTGFTNSKFVVYETVYLDMNDTIQTVADIPSDDQAEQYDGYETMVDASGKSTADMEFFPIRHNDPDDVLQQLKIPTAHTTTMGGTEDHIGIVGENKFVDRVYYKDLIIGESYTIEGKIHIIDDEAGTDEIYKDDDGNEVVATKTFKATQEEGYEDIEFTIDAAKLMGERIICEDGIRQGKRRIVFHDDLKDEDEAYYIPEIHTSTRNTKIDKTKITDEDKDSAKEVKAAEGESFTDTISYQALIANRTWRVRGVLMDKATGQVMVDATGKEIKATTTFETKNVDAVPITTYPYRSDYEMADGTVLDLSADHADYLANGTIDLEFKGYDFTNLANKTGVVFEEVYLVTTDADGNEKESLVAEHKDIQDIDQFTYFIECKTKAQDTTTKTRVVPLNQKTIVQDTIIYKNTIPGKTYKATSKFVVKNDKSGKYKDGDTLLGADGKPVTATVTFTPDKPDGEVIVDIPLDTNNLVDMELVVYEDITNTLGLEVATHADINDDYQTIEVPGGETTATDNATGDHVSSNQKTVTITDVITFRNLEPGKEYTAQGQLYYKDGKPVEADGKPVINTVKFTPKEKNGTVEVPFTINAELLAGQTLIVFEDISVNKIPVFMHHDLNDESQSVHIPEIGTTATFKDGSKSQTASKKVTIVDKCAFKNLILGQSYTIKGVLYNKSTGEKLVVDGKNVTAEKTFTAETTEGTVELEFTFDASSLSGDVVAYEYAYHNDVEVATHTDINDQGQTVSLVPPSKTPPKTGMIVFFIILGLMAAGGAGMLIFRRKRA